MPFDAASHLTALLPLAENAGPIALACMLDRMADLALFQGRAMHAEHLAHRAIELREREQ